MQRAANVFAGGGTGGLFFAHRLDSPPVNWPLATGDFRVTFKSREFPKNRKFPGVISSRIQLNQISSAFDRGSSKDFYVRRLAANPRI